MGVRGGNSSLGKLWLPLFHSYTTDSHRKYLLYQENKTSLHTVNLLIARGNYELRIAVKNTVFNSREYHLVCMSFTWFHSTMALHYVELRQHFTSISLWRLDKPVCVTSFRRHCTCRGSLRTASNTSFFPRCLSSLFSSEATWQVIIVAERFLMLDSLTFNGNLAARKLRDGNKPIRLLNTSDVVDGWWGFLREEGSRSWMSSCNFIGKWCCCVCVYACVWWGKK